MTHFGEQLRKPVDLGLDLVSAIGHQLVAPFGQNRSIENVFDRQHGKVFSDVQTQLEVASQLKDISPEIGGTADDEALAELQALAAFAIQYGGNNAQEADAMNMSAPPQPKMQDTLIEFYDQAVVAIQHQKHPK